jgi:hypothetical protein
MFFLKHYLRKVNVSHYANNPLMVCFVTPAAGLYTWSARKVLDRIFLCEHLMYYNLARLHEPTLNLSAHA